MHIKLNSKSVIELQGEQNVVNVAFRGGKLKGELGENLLIAPTEEVGAISSPGEYEYNGVSIVGMETKGVHIGTMELALVQIDRIHVLSVLDDVGEVTSENYDFLDEVDILILDKSIAIEDVTKFINRIDPYVVIVINSSKEDAEKWVSLIAEAEDKKFKFNEKDFEAEEFVARLLVLN